MNSQLPFDGTTYNPKKDSKRLGGQLLVVRDYMLLHDWVPLATIAKDLDYPEGSVSARLRDLRKPKFGGYLMDARRVGDGGTWEYRVLPDGNEMRKEVIPFPDHVEKWIDEQHHKARVSKAARAVETAADALKEAIRRHKTLQDPLAS